MGQVNAKQKYFNKIIFLKERTKQIEATETNK